jgi:hypothetical protein
MFLVMGLWQKESLMLGKSLLIFSAVALGAVPGPAEARSDPVAGSAKAGSDVNTHADESGYHPGRRSFYGFPRHRHIDGGGDADAAGVRSFGGSDGRSSNFDGNHGSAYYGTNYGAPYYGGGYYDGGVYYRERRD